MPFSLLDIGLIAVMLISGILEHAAAQFGDSQIVSRETHGPVFRYTYAECAARVKKLANALADMGLSSGAVAGSLAWNNHRHVEIYYAVSGSGLVIHTCNPRLHAKPSVSTRVEFNPREGGRSIRFWPEFP